MSTNGQVHVEDLVLGEGETAEQVISLAGPLHTMQIALPMILEKAGRRKSWRNLEELNPKAEKHIIATVFIAKLHMAC